MAGMGAFWRFGLASTSKIESILKKEEFTLEELLDDEDILQECRQATIQELTDFLSQPEQIKKLIGYVIDEPSGDIDERQKYKYSNIASEVLTSECWPIVEGLCQPEAQDLLWSLLDKPQPLNPLLTSLFGKVIQMQLNKDVQMVTKYVLGKPELQDKLLSHLATPAIKDILQKMATAENRHGAEMTFEEYWANDRKLVSILVGLFDTANSGASDAVLANVTMLLGDVVTDARREAIGMQEYSTPLAFLDQIIDARTIGELLGYMFAEGSSEAALLNGLELINILLTEPERGEDEAPPSAIDKARHTQEVAKVMEAIVSFIPQIVNLLSVPPEGLVTASGELKPPLGFKRLLAARTIEALVLSDNAEFAKDLVKLNTIEPLLDLFHKYPDNNFLHQHVCNIVTHIASKTPTEADPYPLHRHLFEDMKIMDRILVWFKAGMSAEQSQTKTRLAYTGHVIIMANALDASTKTEGNPFALYFDKVAVEEGQETKKQTWEAFTSTELKSANEQQETAFEHRAPLNEGFTSDESDDDDMLLEPDAQHQYNLYRTDKIAIEIPDNYGIHDEDEEDEDEKLADAYGQLGPFSAEDQYSTDITTTASVKDWKIRENDGTLIGTEKKKEPQPEPDSKQESNALTMDDNAFSKALEDMTLTTKPDTITTSTVPNDDDPFGPSVSSVVANVDPFAVDDGSALSSSKHNVDPLVLSKDPFDADEANDTSTPMETTANWADFGSIHDQLAETVAKNVIAHATNNTDKSNPVQTDDAEDEPLPSLPNSESTTPVASPDKKVTLTVDGGDDNMQESSTDTPDAPKNQAAMLDIEGGGHLFGSAV